MESIRYVDRHVPDEKVAELEAQIGNQLNPMQGFALFKGFLKYANLHAWRNQLLHEFLGTRVEGNGNYLMCACGLDAFESDTETHSLPSHDLPTEIGALNLSKLIRIRHHVDFSDNPKPVTALIVATSFDHELKQRFFSAYCQTCLDFIIDAKHQAAEKFITSHNSSHLD